MNVVEDFVEKHLSLLQVEYEEEIKQKRKYQENLSISELQQCGDCLSKLKIVNQKTGLFGRFIIVFAHFIEGKPLPSHKLASGDIIGVCLKNDRTLIDSGIIVSHNPSTISIAFDGNVEQFNEDENGNYCVIKLANEITYKRIKTALQSLRKFSPSDRAGPLVDVLFGQGVSDPLDVEGLENIKFFNDNLNYSQRDAVHFALSQKEVAIIHGPPGTGKTTTLVEAILQMVDRGNRVLVCAASNVAVDTLVEKLAAYRPRDVLRLGHPARALPSAQLYSLDALLCKSDQHQLIDDIRKEIDSLRRQCPKIGGIRSEIGLLRKELKAREKKALSESLKSAKIILSTLTSASSDSVLKYMLKSNDPKDAFDVVVIDECSQAIEAACWIVLGYAPKCILAGDHKQLPPTIISEKAAKAGLEKTLMERLLKVYNEEKIMRMLLIQYRMNVKIMEWSSAQFYNGKLQAHDSVANHTIQQLVPSVDLPPLLLIDTTGCSMNELDVEDEMSKGNESEANIVAAYVEKLINDGVDPHHIGVITPYNLQVELIRNRLACKYPSLEVNSVDGFQGREKEIIILSLVRSNDRKEVGFLSDSRRINVAVTRAKRHLAVVCDSDTVSNDEILSSFVEYMTENGEVRCAQEYEESMSRYVNVERPKNLRLKSTNVVKDDDKSGRKIAKKKASTKQGSLWDSYENQNSRDEKLRAKFQNVLDEFFNSEQKCFMFPNYLSSYERMLVHELAEKMNLYHRSKGDGSDRVIEIRKVENAREGAEKDETEWLDKEQDEKAEWSRECKEEKEETVVSSAEKEEVGNTIPRIEKAKETRRVEQICNRQKSLLKPKERVVEKPKSLVGVRAKNKPNLIKKDQLSENLKDLEEDNGDDLDKMIAAAKKADNVCSFNNCKTKVAVLGQHCQFCNYRFCLTHAMPEIHGCGDAIKAYCRSVVRKEGKLYSGSGLPDKKLDSISRNQLQRQLTKKVNELTEKRKGKRK